ncbi:serine/threonine-protein kinase-like protein [Cucurbitaria berberidis CBS 394.84]|uniref:Serine/threonine-protein kinase-like protein n=1 Tax=Cucurbitaria berberidis CBS 394.84 TaxID=1168544 RepID=A0A9P4LCW5_9PLEO|nr:serine/threonine-protein kinase-like protein [Cucurbitaria berberidis CBS 394.84]KAF1850103.1 serine/threonine-protein kinase-like protein [Cucurbitaria berberidis CBS 394.84]
MVNEELPLYSARDLSPRYEAFAEEDDEDGNPIFLYSSFGYISDEYVAYFGQSNLRKCELNQKIIRESLQRLPDEDVYPEAPSDITVVLPPIDETLFLKRPKLHLDFLGTGLLPKLMLHEAETMELPLRNPHPHIVRYHGCLIKRGRIVSLVLDRLPITLQHRLEKNAQHFDVENCMRKMKSAIRHLHSLGRAHNDLTLMKVMIDKSDDPIIVDYSSCQPFGNTLITAGTPGWVDEDFTISAQEHDQIALDKIRKWIEKLTRAAKNPRTGHLAYRSPRTRHWLRGSLVARIKS